MGHTINETDRVEVNRKTPWHGIGSVADGTPWPTFTDGGGLRRVDSPVEEKAAEVRAHFRKLEVEATVTWIWVHACAEVSGLDPSRMSDEQRKEAYVLASQQLGELVGAAAYHDSVEGCSPEPIVDEMWDYLQKLMQPTPIPDICDDPDARSVPVK